MIKKNNKVKRFLAMLLFVMMFFNVFTVYADDMCLRVDSTVSVVNSKIDSKLQEVMDKAADQKLIPVWLWLESIDDELVNRLMIKEKGMDPAVYEDESKFNANRLPQIEKQVEAELGYKKAHEVIMSDEVVSASKVTLIDIVVGSQTGRTPIDEAVSKEFDEYIMEKRSIQKREQSACNIEFIDTHIKQFGDRKIIYNGEYTSTLIVEATREEIEYYSYLDNVMNISLYEPSVEKPALDVALEQVGIYCVGGTGYDASDWVAQSGHGVTIGILEAGNGYYDSNAEQLKNNNKLSIVYNDNPSSDLDQNPYQVSNHATMVTSIICGKRKVVNSKSYEGVAPSATVYQMPIRTKDDVLNGIKQLAGMGVNIINYSGGSSGATLHYTDYDKEVDKLISKLSIVFVVSAGNFGESLGWISSPAKALNAITVGNARTKEALRVDENNKPIDPLVDIVEKSLPYTVASSSSYLEADYLPNKPDIVAPGQYISFVKSEGVLYADNGTSVSAPIVTGILAQMMSENSSLKTNPLVAKAALLLGASHSLLNTTDDTELSLGMRNKSGMGLIDAKYALGRVLSSTKVNIDLNTSTISDSYYFEQGDNVKAIMVYCKNHTKWGSPHSDYIDNLQFILINDDNDRIVFYNTSEKDNVEALNVTINVSGYYHFVVIPQRIVAHESMPDVAIAFRVFG